MHYHDLRDIQGGKVVQITKNWIQAGHEKYINICVEKLEFKICLIKYPTFHLLGSADKAGLVCWSAGLLGWLLVAVLLVQPGTVTSGGPRKLNYIRNPKLTCQDAALTFMYLEK